MNKENKNTHSAGSNPAPKAYRWVTVKPSEKDLIDKTVSLLVSEFCRRAKALGIPIIKRKKGRNVPGQPEAVECLLAEEWGDCSLENKVYWYVQTRIIAKYQGAQA